MRRPLPRIETLDLLRETNEALVDLLESLSPHGLAEADGPQGPFGEGPRRRTCSTVRSAASRSCATASSASRSRASGYRRPRRVHPAPEPRVDCRHAPPQPEDARAHARAKPTRRCSRFSPHDDPDAPAVFSVAWAGEDKSAHWFDVAREYTEKWHHQQQIRDAVGRPDLASRRHLHAGPRDVRSRTAARLS